VARVFAIFILSVGILTSQVQSQSSLKHDTIRFIGKCRYTGSTRSITAAHYYNFEVIKVLKGKFEGKIISFEADANSTNETFFASYQRGGPVNLSADSLFYGHQYPVEATYTCSSQPFDVAVFKREASVGFPEKMIVVYYKVWNKPKVKK
jgi:hypothetical protein